MEHVTQHLNYTKGKTLSEEAPHNSGRNVEDLLNVFKIFIYSFV